MMVDGFDLQPFGPSKKKVLIYYADINLFTVTESQ